MSIYEFLKILMTGRNIKTLKCKDCKDREYIPITKAMNKSLGTLRFYYCKNKKSPEYGRVFTNFFKGCKIEEE